MAIALESVTTDWDGATNYSFAVNAGTGANRCLVLLVGIQDSNHGNYPVVSATYNGVSLTKIRSDEAAGNNRTEIWYLKNPTSGSNTLQINGTGAVLKFYGVYILTGVDQTNPVDAQNGTSGNSSAPSTSVTTVAANAFIVSTLSHEDGVNTIGSGQTQQYDLDSQSYENATGGSRAATTATAYTMNWSLASGQSWAISAASFAPAGGAAITVKTLAALGVG